MRAEGLRGIPREKTRKTTIGDGAETERPEDLAKRNDAWNLRVLVETPGSCHIRRAFDPDHRCAALAVPSDLQDLGRGSGKAKRRLLPWPRVGGGDRAPVSLLDLAAGSHEERVLPVRGRGPQRPPVVEQRPEGLDAETQRDDQK